MLCRECGCDGEFTGFRNYQNKQHINDLAAHWNVNPEQISHWFVPTHIMQILHFIEQGSIRFLWISGTNPAVSLPQLARIRKLLQKPDMFVIAQDIFPTETTDLADVVLPAAMCMCSATLTYVLPRTDSILCVCVVQGARRPVPSPTLIGHATSPKKPSIHPVSARATSTSSSTTHGACSSKTRTAAR